MGAIALSSLPATARTQPTSSPSPTRQGQITDAAEADAIYTDGTILTMSDAQPTAVAVAVKDGKILAVGSKEMAIRQVWCGGCDR